MSFYFRHTTMLLKIKIKWDTQNLQLNYSMIASCEILHKQPHNTS